MIPVTTTGDVAQVDLLSVSGTVDMSGTVKANFVVSNQSATGQQVTGPIITAGGDVTTTTETDLTIVASAVAQNELAFIKNSNQEITGIAINYEIDFNNTSVLATAGDNQQELARHTHAAYKATALDLGLAQALVDIEDIDSYQSALDSLGAEVYAANELTTLLSTQRFGDALLNCAQRDGPDRFVRDGQCSWVNLQGIYIDRDNDNDNQGFKESAIAISIGAQFAFLKDWSFGGGLSYEARDLTMDDGWAKSEGDQVQGGLVLKRRFGETLLSSSVSGGYGHFEVERALFTGDQAKGDLDIAFVSGQLRASHAFEQDNWYLRPRLDLAVDYIHTDSLEESNAGALGLAIEKDGQVYVSLQPAIEVGGEIATEKGVLLRPNLTLGITQYLTDESPETKAHFLNGSNNVTGFTSQSDLDRTFFDFEAGLEVITDKGWVVSVEGFGQISENIKSYGGSLQVSIPF